MHIEDDIEKYENDPVGLFRTWLDEAARTETAYPEAMSLATVDGRGQPTVRMVLLKKVDTHGFVFYSNGNSRKGRDIQANPRAGLCFYWRSMARQVRVDGKVEEISPIEADTYYYSRSISSRIGAWASDQSQPLDSRETLEKRVKEFEQKFGEDVPRPDHWKGFCLIPERIEFWQEGEERLHDRFEFTREGEGEWSLLRLYP